MPAVEVRGLTVRYGPAGTPPAVDNLDLSADAGEVLVVLGPNGAGKTSTVETLEGYRRPATGEVRVLGLDPVVDHAALTGRMGVMLQGGGVYPMLGPKRVLDLFAAYYPDPVPTGDLLETVGLRAVAATPVASSLGRRAAATFAGARAHRPAGGGLPRRADQRRRPRGSDRHPGGRRWIEGQGSQRRADDPRVGRGRARLQTALSSWPRDASFSRARPTNWPLRAVILP